MDINLLKKLIKLVEGSGITDFSVQEGDLKVRISKNPDKSSHIYMQPSPNYGIYQTPPATQLADPGQSMTPAEAPAIQDQLKFYEVKSPIVGTFYRAPL